MGTVRKINKKIVLKCENRMINLPEDLKNKIEVFWNKCIIENPKLYNGEEFSIERVEETENELIFYIVKTNYAHYLYNERIGITDEKLRCNAPYGGIILLTKDNYFVIGEMHETTSVPYCLQIFGGGIDEKDIVNNIIDINLNIQRELKEEINVDLKEVNYKLEYVEFPNETRNAYGFLAVGNINKTKSEIENQFNEYKKYLIDNDLEIEFNRLLFINKENALNELENIPSQKRPYLRDLIENIVK